MNNEEMKKEYNTPELTEHGDVEEITQAFGPSSVKDTVFVGGANIPGGTTITGTGSRDGIVVPQ